MFILSTGLQSLRLWCPGLSTPSLPWNYIPVWHFWGYFALVHVLIWRQERMLVMAAGVWTQTPVQWLTVVVFVNFLWFISPDTLRKYLGSIVEGTGKFHGTNYQCPCNINGHICVFCSYKLIFFGDSAVQLFIGLRRLCLFQVGMGVE